MMLLLRYRCTAVLGEKQSDLQRGGGGAGELLDRFGAAVVPLWGYIAQNLSGFQFPRCHRRPSTRCAIHFLFFFFLETKLQS